MKSPKTDLAECEAERLKRLFNSNGSDLRFLSYEASLATTEIHDGLRGKTLLETRETKTLWTLLAHLSEAEPKEKTGKLVDFRDLPGGYAYDKAFLQRAVKPISENFGGEPGILLKAGELLGGAPRAYGDASIEISSLPRIPLTYILWEEGEFPASANILFEESARHYLPTEDLAVLAEITTFRLLEARGSLR